MELATVAALSRTYRNALSQTYRNVKLGAEAALSRIYQPRNALSRTYRNVKLGAVAALSWLQLYSIHLLIKTNTSCALSSGVFLFEVL